MADDGVMERAWIIRRPPRFVLPLAGPLGAVVLGAIMVLSLA
jgi:hypothetical protein